MSRFLFIGGAPVLDFVNTEIVSGGERVDLLESVDDVRAWLAEAGLAEEAGRVPLEEVRQFRALLRAMLLRGKAQKNHVDAINEALHRGEGKLALVRKKGTFRTKFDADSRDPLFLLGAAAAEFLAHADLSLVKSCGGTGCILLFYDETKSHTRRWCSMAACGNRMKAALHYRRRKIGGP